MSNKAALVGFSGPPIWCAAYDAQKGVRMFGRPYARRPVRYVMAALTAALAVAAPANAAPCGFPDTVGVPMSTNLSTGRAAAGIAIPYGLPDPRWVITSTPTGLPSAAFVVRPNPGFWTSTSGADWLSASGAVTGDPSAAEPAGAYTYTTRFVVVSSAAALSLQYATDDSVQFRLNGVLIGSGGVQHAFTSLTYSGSAFVDGVNTLEARVTNNAYSGINPEGLLLSGALTQCFLG